MRNPFKALGIDPSVLRGMSIEEVRFLTKAQFRALSRIYHPDVGGRPDSFRAIAEAINRLEETDTLKADLERHLARRSDKVSVLEERTGELQRDLDNVTKTALSFIELVAREGLDIGDTKILVRDTVAKVAIHDIAQKNRRVNLPDDPLLEVSIEADRRIRKTRLEYAGLVSVPKDASESCLRSDDGTWLLATKNHLSGEITGYRSFEPKGKTRSTLLCAVGTIPEDREILESTGYPLAALASFEGVKRGDRKVADGYPLEAFLGLLQVMSPKIEANRTLIGSQVVEDEVRYHIIGQILETSTQRVASPGKTGCSHDPEGLM